MDSSAPAGFFHSLRALGDSLLGTVENRLSLFAVELQEEKFRLIQTVIWVAAILAAAGMALAFLSLTLAFWLWSRSPVLAMGVLAGLYTVTAVGLALGFRRHLARQPRPFDATLRELSEDRTCIRGDN